MRIIPWTPTKLENFVTCPRQFNEVHVVKSVIQTETEQSIWGSRVHKDFEERVAHGKPLPPELAEHEPYLASIEKEDGVFFTECKIALDRKCRPCHFFAPTEQLWYRGVIDFKRIREGGTRARIVDYKTGRSDRPKIKQLASYALHTFYSHPTVDEIDAEFYWTQTRGQTSVTYRRAEIPTIWDLFIPDLAQYREAFETNTWQPRPSGLCHGWCPVKTCEHWKPKRLRS